MLGVCYYPEHWPQSMWADDAKKMRDLGLTYVRIGEFAWSRMEPQDGVFKWAWLDEAIDTLVNAGLKVILGTPTATPPKWLVDKYPEILPVDPNTGTTRGFGSRRHYDFSSEVYFRESMRITEAMATRYGKHPGVVGWQTDNELCCHDTTMSASPAARRDFQAWCRKTYGDIDSLNKAWGTVFWSMEYNDFSDIELPVLAVTETHPSHRLAYRRFSSDQVVKYHDAMIDVIRKHSPGKFVTHNFIPPTDTNADNFALADKLDFTTYDNYPLGRTDLFFGYLPTEEFHRYMRTGHPDYATFFHDHIRGLSHGAYWIMEQQPGPVNWAFHNPRPAPGMIRLWTLEAFAHGAECVCYFRWRQAAFAQEQMHAGLRRPDNSPSDAWPEVEKVRDEINQLTLSELPIKKSRVALMTTTEGQWLSDIEKQGITYDFWRVQFSYYSALRQLGVDVDIVSEKADFSSYDLVVVPNWPIMTDSLVEKIGASQTPFVFGPRTGAKTPEFTFPDNLPPGPLQKLIPLKVTSVETARADCAEPFTWNNKNYMWSSWRDEIEVDPQYVCGETEQHAPIVIEHEHYHYIAALADDAFLRDFFAQRCEQHGIALHPSQIDLRISHRGGLGFAFNYSREAKTLNLPESTNFLLGGITVPPLDVSIWKAS